MNMNVRIRCFFFMVAQMSLLTGSALGAQVFFSDATTGVIYRANLDGTGVTPVVQTGSSGFTLPIEVDPVGQRIYWAEAGASFTEGSQIRSSTYGGGDIQTLVDNSDTGLILDLEFDQASQQIYWTDDRLNRIEKINLDATGRENLATVESVTGIALDLPNDFIYYTADASNGIVGGYDLANDMATELIDGPSSCCSFGSVWDVELDADSNRLYFLDEDNSDLFSIGTDGSGFTELFEPSDGLTPFGLELHESSLYVAFKNTGDVISIPLPTANTDDEFDVISAGHVGPSGIAIDPLAVPEPNLPPFLVVSLCLLASFRRHFECRT